MPFQNIMTHPAVSAILHKKYLPILFCFLMITIAGSSQSTFDWVGKTKLKDIVYPGKKYTLIQYCDPKADSIAANGKVTFASASIDGVQDLELSYLIKDTILLSTEMTTLGKENCGMLNTKIKEITGNLPAFIHYGKGKHSIKYMYSEKKGWTISSIMRPPLT